MEKRGATLLAAAVVRDAVDDVPSDILARLARRVDEERFEARGVRTHAIVVESAPIENYRAAAAMPLSLRVVALGSSSLEDVRFDLDGRRLRWEVRFPKERRLAALLWWGFVVLPVALAFGVGAITSPAEMPWHVFVVALAVCTMMAWALTVWFVHDTGVSIRDEMRRILEEAINE